MAGQKFTLTFDAQLNVGQMKGALTNIQNELNRLQLPANLTKGISGTLNSLEKEIRNFEVLSGKDLSDKSNFGAFERSAEKIGTLFKDLQIQARDLGKNVDIEKLFPSAVVDNIKNSTNAIKAYEKSIQTIENRVADLNKKIKDQKDLLDVRTERRNKTQQELEEAQKNAPNIQQLAKESGVKGEISDYASLKKAIEEAAAAKKQYDAEVKKGERKSNALTEKGLENRLVKLQAIQAKVDAYQKDVIDPLKGTLGKDNTAVANTTRDLQELEGVLAKFTASIDTTKTEEIQKLFTALNDNGLDTSKYQQNLEGAKQALQDYITAAGGNAEQALNSLTNSINANSGAVEKNTADVRDSVNAYRQYDTQVRDVGALKSRIQYFFGLTNAVNLAKRAIRSAFNTIKDLDKVMTETAVVTDYDISDMWKQLPEYTKRANELGVTTQQAYESATLFYQQGLNTQQAAALSTETLKMARIAGLDAAEATDRMTNALRGFNMALDEQSAQRVDDVYSQLAAHSASNVDEISTAMTKVASLAHSANMEFETTAAFLAQIIETTRESAETAGTALKTVVARFSEVKKLYSEDQLKGTDEEGQGIDVNKISTALRTAGIDLNKYFLGEVGLDDIFMELASKWDSLTSVQQRYIATQAAGSRQQSRFIALMQDYARTQELVGMAYNANGASAKQFEKTQESLQSKLARLKNAWNEFLMGLANNNIVKGIVTGLTDLLNIINKITGALGNSTNFVLKWVAAFGAYKGLKAIFRGGGLLDKTLGTIVSGTGVGTALAKGGVLSGKTLTGTMAGVTPTVVTAAPRVGLFGRMAAYKQAAATNPTVVKTLNPEWSKYQNLSPAERIQQYSAGNMPSQYLVNNVPGRTPKTMFGAMGNNFIKTGVGNKIAQTGLAKKLTRKGMESMIPAGANGALTSAASGAAALGAALIYVAAAAAIVAGAFYAWYQLSPEGQLIQAKKYAKAMDDAADNAKKNAANLKQAKKEYEEYSDEIEKATTLSKKQQAIQKRNESLTALASENRFLQEFITSRQENGQLILEIEPGKLEEAIAAAEAGAAKAASDASFSHAMQAGKQADVYAAQITRAGIDQAITKKSWYDDYGVYHERELTNAEKTRYQKIAEARDRSRIEMQNYAKQGYLEDLADNDLSDDLANMLAESMAKNFNEDRFLEDVNKQRRHNWWRNADDSTGGTRKELEAEYLRMYGSLPDASMKRRDLAKAVAQGQVNEKRTEQTDTVAALVATNDRVADILRAYNGQGSFNNGILNLNIEDTGTLFAALGVENTEKDMAAFSEELGALASAMGITVDQLLVEIKTRAKLVKQQQAKRVSSVAANMYQSGLSDQTIIDFIKNGNFEQQDLIGKIFESFDSSVLSDKFFSDLQKSINDSDVLEWAQSLDFSKPTQTLSELTKVAENGTGAMKNMAQALLKAAKESSAFSTAGQFSAFILSSSYESITEELDKFIEENEHLSSAKIIELAESNSELKDLLDNNVMSAKALALAIESIQIGELAPTDLSDALLAALNAADDLDGVVSSIINKLNNFDPGYDENDIVGFINSALDNATENIEKGAYGNNVMRSYMEEIFGTFDYEGPAEGYGEAYKAWLNKNVAWLEANKENMYSAWSEFIGGEGMQKTLKAANGRTATVLQQNGEILIKNVTMTTDELVQAIVDNSDYTKTQAEMMIADYKNYSADFAHMMAQNDLPHAIEAWVAALPKIDGQSFYDEEDILRLAKLLNLDAEEVEAAVNKMVGANEKYQKIKWTNDDNVRTADSILKAWEELGQDLRTERDISYDYNGRHSNDVLDYDKIKQLYSSTGQAQRFTSDFEAMAQQEGKFVAKIFGETTDIIIKEGQTAGEAYNEAVTKATADLNGTAMAKAMSDELRALFKELGLIIEGEDGAHFIDIGTTLTPINTTDVTTIVNDAQTWVNEHCTLTIPVTVGTVDTGPIDLGNGRSFTYSGRGGVWASGGIIDSYAQGSENIHGKPGIALTGEEGPELIWNKKGGYAYLTGKKGPEFQDLKPGDRIFNASETKQIFKNSDDKISSFAKGGIIPAYSGVDNNIVNNSSGYDGANKNNKKNGSGSGGSGKDKDDEWKNDLDWLYNVMENIAELERQQTKLEEEYEDLLTDQTKTGQDLYKMLIQQLGNLYAQLDHQTYTLERREQEMREFMDTTNDKDEYLWYNWNDRTLEIDWDAIDAIKDEDEYNHIKDLISEAESIQDKMDDAEDAIIDINNSIQELENIWRDTFTDFEDRVLDAIVASYQKVIDNYSELNDTLNDTNSAILDAIDKEISLQRQIRDNTKTEQEISDDEARLAFLRRDTSGGNDTAAMELEKDLNDRREDYSDTLVDQAIERLQDDNEIASQQREKQIEIMQAQLDYQHENGEFNAYVRELLTSAIGEDGELLNDSNLVTLLKDTENWGAMSEVSKQVWEEELQSTFKEVVAFLLKEQNQAEGTYFTAVTAAFNNLQEEFDKFYHGSYSQSGAGGSSGSGSGGGSDNGSTPGSQTLKSRTPNGDNDFFTKADAEKLISLDKSITYLQEGGARNGVTGETYAAMIAERNALITKSETTTHGSQAKKLDDQVEEIVKKGKTGTSDPSRKEGGSVEQTGWAMLHGTISDPEYVLNARQTEAFLKLADVLPAAMSSTGSISNATFGASTINLAINVDKIDSDYSVDRMVDRVKEKLFESGSYRNNNVLNFLR